jgi:hypothetical protein
MNKKTISQHGADVIYIPMSGKEGEDGIWQRRMANDLIKYHNFTIFGSKVVTPTDLPGSPETVLILKRMKV